MSCPRHIDKPHLLDPLTPSAPRRAVRTGLECHQLRPDSGDLDADRDGIAYEGDALSADTVGR